MSFLKLIFVLFFVLLFSACPAPVVRPPQGIEIRCSHGEAKVFVNGHFVGRGRRVFDKVISLPPGRHLVEVQMDGYYTRYREIEVRRGEVYVLSLDLHPEIQWKRRFPGGKK